MKIYLLIYRDAYPNYSIQKVEDYWDLIYESEPISIIEITKDMLKELKEVSDLISDTQQSNVYTMPTIKERTDV